MAGKSAAKIRRNIARAAARGETYTPPEPSSKKDDNEGDVNSGSNKEDDKVIQTKLSAAQKLEETLSNIESNADNLNAKERRSAKRKAEAIALEESRCDNVDELMNWYKKNKPASTKGKKKKKQSANVIEQLSQEDKAKFESAKKLHTSLAELEKDDSLNAKERRSAKRKAEAIASEETNGTDSKELLEWYEKIVPPASTTDGEKAKKIPYIIFVGQLSYTTTSDMLYNHFQTTLSKSGTNVTRETMKIRLLTDSKTKKSRGMAFVELSTPEIMYECLKLHLTHLDGRRINVERSAGGRSNSASKKAKITSYREEQTSFMSQTMDSIISSFIKKGEIEEDELDDGVIALCKRHSAVVIEAALKEYVEEKKERKIKKETLGEKEDENLRNPSAFLTHMIGRIAEEGIGNSSRGRTGRDKGGRGRGPGRGNGGRGRGGSILQRSGVDMSMSSRTSGDGKSISQIFPSMGGRGRGGRGAYMR